MTSDHSFVKGSLRSLFSSITRVVGDKAAVLSGHHCYAVDLPILVEVVPRMMEKEETRRTLGYKHSHTHSHTQEFRSNGVMNREGTKTVIRRAMMQETVKGKGTSRAEKTRTYELRRE